jgi:hypothetical protein
MSDKKYSVNCAPAKGKVPFGRTRGATVDLAGGSNPIFPARLHVGAVGDRSRVLVRRHAARKLARCWISLTGTRAK